MKLGRRKAQDGPSWQQGAPKMGHDGAKMAILGSVWQLLGGPGSISGYFFRDFYKNGRSVKTNKTTSLLIIFLGYGASSGGSWRLSWEGFGSYVRRCWLQDGAFLDILADAVASWCQDGAQERQDEAR